MSNYMRTRKTTTIGLMAFMGSVSLPQSSSCMEIKSYGTGDTTHYGIPANFKTGGNLLQENEAINSHGPTAYNSFLDELLGRYDELYEIALQKHDDITLSEYDRRILTPPIISHIPAALITAQTFNPSDGLFDTAIKLERLGLIIKDLTFPVISEEAYNLRHILMSHCFVKAGHYAEQAAKNLLDNAEDQVDLVVLDDMYKTSGQFFHWAAVHMPKNAGDIVERRANILFAKVSG